MKNINLKVRQAATRLGLNAFLKLLSKSLFAVLFVAAAVVVLQKLIHFEFNVAYVICGLLGAALAFAVAGALIKKHTRFSTAVLLDERMNLKERISSAVLSADDQSPVAIAVVKDADKSASAVKVKEKFPLTTPKEFRWVTIPAACLVVAFILPEYDLFKRKETIEAKAKAREQVKREAKQLEKRIQQRKKEGTPIKMAEVKKLLKDLEKVAEELRQKPEDKKQALAKLSKLSEKMRNLRKQLVAKKKLQPQLPNLGLRSEIGRQLKKAIEQGNYMKAAEQLAALQKKLSDKNLSKKEKEQMKRELESLSKKLEEAGMEDLAKKLADAAGEMKMADLQKALDKLDEAKDQFGALQSMVQDLDILEAAMNDMEEMKNQLSDMNWDKSGACKKCGMGKCSKCGGSRCRHGGKQCKGGGQCSGSGTGLGMGGPGRGRGNIAPENPSAATDTKKTRIPGQIGKGKIIGSFFVDGEQLKGEAVVEFQEVTEAARQEATDALVQEDIPQNRKDLVKDYFDSLDQEKQD